MKSQENKTINTPSRVTTLTTDEWIGFLLPWATKKYYSARANFEYDNNTNKKSGDNDSQIKFNLVVVVAAAVVVIMLALSQRNFVLKKNETNV